MALLYTPYYHVISENKDLTLYQDFTNWIKCYYNQNIEK